MGKIMRRVLIVVPAVALQVLWHVLLVKWLAPYAPLIVSLVSVAAVFMVLFIVIKRDESTYKLLWLLIILTMPLVGALLYLFFGNKRTAKPLKKRLQSVENSGDPHPLSVGETPFTGEKRMEQTIRWLEKKTGYPLCKAQPVRYYPLGDDMFPDMLRDMKNAKRSIYIEYFIIEPGQMWDAMMAVLEDKLRQGVDVRVMYDDLGSISSFNFSNARELTQKGIPCVPFNPLLALKGTANYRDHRKMLIVDNEIAYSGGINLSDRYINLEHPYGHWKDTGVLLRGEAVRSLTVMFLEMWNAAKRADRDYSPYTGLSAGQVASDGFVQPYADSPLDDERVGENVYMNMIKGARHYCWITTPYLILDDEMSTELILAAKRGVDVRIITPGIPDKKLVFQLTRSYYAQLARGGVRIYEYTPGFVHAKQMLVDGETAAVGTINLDYRSLYLHFENAVLLYRCGAIQDIRRDFEATFPLCREVTDDYRGRRVVRIRVWQSMLRLFAPLL